MQGPLIKRTDIWPSKHTEAEHISYCGFVVTNDPMAAGNAQTIGNAAGRTIYVRCRTSGIITKIGYLVGVQSGNISVAAYANSGSGRTSVPGVRLATSGAVACPAAGYQETALPNAVRVDAGDWLAISCDNNTATFQAVLNAGIVNLAAGLLAYSDATHPAPASNPTVTGYGSRSMCLVGIP